MAGIADPLSYELDNCGDITLTLDEQDVGYEDDEDYYLLPELPSYQDEIRIEEKCTDTASLDIGDDPFVPSTKKNKKKGASRIRVSTRPDSSLFTSWPANDQFRVDSLWPVEDDLPEGWGTQRPPAGGNEREDSIQDADITEGKSNKEVQATD
ncbi:hypothetical protein LOZ58_006879 [Ophidiomyces ophidiicola]|nr:hypothetical protein LOZ58_006879 [Ophidiomyces ophidiicola]